MKKFFVVAVSLLLCAAAWAQPKFAHVNFSELVQLMPESDQARATLQASSKEAQDTYQGMVDEYNNKLNQYTEKVNSMTQAIKESKERELTDIQVRIQQFSQSIQQELAQQEQQLMAPIYKKAQDTVNDLAKKGGYIYVFDRTSILYIDESQSTDLTPAARKVLNIPADRTLETLQAELQAQANQ